MMLAGKSIHAGKTTHLVTAVVASTETHYLTVTCTTKVVAVPAEIPHATISRIR
ncbi:Hypothetical protein, putative [Bodo saltans]|uniref:GPI-anchored surface protein n=1 Tax=Bodo saltans TaxID=75058 RepID=A0A0S4J6Q0_BODSA|nr:Hypothetical protein, putative [Bodo saltans]|eukprot:CUG45378.1 Hypothetical protein, putative [Bodo saltans]